MTEATPLASEQITRDMIADIIAAHVSGPTFRDVDLRLAHRDDQLTAVDAILAALSASPAPSGVSVGSCHCVGLGLPNSSCPDCKGSGSKEAVEQSWTGDPHGLANELRRVANSFGAGFRLTQLLRDAADEIDCLTTQIASPAPSGQGVSVPEGMKPWSGGWDEPRDWDKADVLRRNGRMTSAPSDAMEWRRNAGSPFDIIAYTPKPAPAPSCAPGEVGAILGRLPAAPWRVTRSLLADFGASLEVDNDSNFGNIGHIRDYDTACALADLVREAAALAASNKTANMDAVISILKRHWPATPFMHKNCANAILAALSPQGLEAKEGGTVPLYTADEAWNELLNKDDRTSPEEYPDMCLIEKAELRAYMELRQYGPTTPSQRLDAATVERCAQELRDYAVLLRTWTMAHDRSDGLRPLKQLLNDAAAVLSPQGLDAKEEDTMTNEDRADLLADEYLGNHYDFLDSIERDRWHAHRAGALAALNALSPQGLDAKEGGCPSSPDGRHQVDTSMESGPNNCFHCEAPMGGN